MKLRLHCHSIYIYRSNVNVYASTNPSLPFSLLAHKLTHHKTWATCDLIYGTEAKTTFLAYIALLMDPYIIGDGAWRLGNKHSGLTNSSTLYTYYTWHHPFFHHHSGCGVSIERALFISAVTSVNVLMDFLFTSRDFPNPLRDPFRFDDLHATSPADSISESHLKCVCVGFLAIRWKCNLWWTTRIGIYSLQMKVQR